MNIQNSELIKKALDGKKFREECEILFSSSSTTEIKAHGSEIASFSFAETSGLGIRVVSDKKMGLSYTEKINKESVAASMEIARENSKFLPEDEGSAIFESNEEKIYSTFKSDYLSGVTADQKKELALSIERYARDFDKRIINVPEAMYGDVAIKRIVANSYGLFKSEESTLSYGFAYLMASDGTDTTVGMYVQCEKHFSDLNAEKIARLAAEDALEKLGAKEIDSGSYPIVFSPSTASSLLGAFISSGSSPFFGENIQKGRSKLGGKEGEMVASPVVSIIDDPSTFSSGSSSFDDEGIDTEKHVLIDKGRFNRVIHNIYSGRRSGSQSTGNGSRGYSSPLSTKLFTPYLQKSDRSEESLLEEAGSGIYITDVEGLHAGLNSISGDFSVGAKGFIFEEGKKGQAVTNFTVAGNFYNLLKNIAAVADNSRTNDYADFSSPSILVKSLAISGK